MIPGVARAVQSGDARELIDRAAQRYRDARSVCANFDQRIEVALLGRVVESEGRVCAERPNLFAMRFSGSHEGDLVIADGESFWVYYPSLDPGQVTRMRGGASGAYDFFREFLEAPEDRYAIRDEGEERVGQRRCRAFSLSPLSGAAYEGANVWIDIERASLCRVRTLRENGSVRTLTLFRPELGGALPPEVFFFAPPEGVRVFVPGAGAS